MTLAPPPALALRDSFASALPELAQPWEAAPAPDPRVVVVNAALAAELGLPPSWLDGEQAANFFTGNDLHGGATAVAQAYAGHQFGVYVPRLGDGRALLLGELRHADGRWRDIHLKGSGPTPFSRGGDGFAAVGPMLREFLISEALHHLGIPTTRSLAVVGTGRTIRRELPEPGAVLTRVASSHIRVGTFQYARATGDVGLLRRLADYTLERHYPQAAEAPPPERYLNLFRAVVEAQAALVARWMLVGFVHGVMNTDNTTMSGETIDYGPCAFLDAFDPRAVFSSIDTQGRYSYGNQPVVMQWNLARFAESLLPLIDDDQERAIGALEEVLAGFPKQYSTHWLSGMLAKLGLPADGATEGSEIVEDFVGLLASGKVDYTSSFRVLADVARAGDSAPAAALFADSEEFEAWVTRWLSLGPDAAAMDRVNPVYIARNHLVEEALGQAEEGDLDPFERLLEALRAPYVARPELVRYAQPAPPSFGPYRTFCGT